MSKICTKCGNVLSDSAQVCTRCGKSFSASVNRQAGQSMANHQMNSSRQQSATPQWNSQGQSMNSQWNNQGQGMNSQWNNQGQSMNSQWNNQSQGMNSQWNNQSQGMNSQWNTQGAGAPSSKEGFANLKNKVKQQAHKLSSGNKKKVGLIGIGVVALLIILIVAIAGGRKPSNRRLKEQLPRDILTYEYDGQTRTSKVKSLKVEKRMLEKNFDTAYCKVTLEDEFMTRILYLEITSQKYTRGGWNITSCSLYQSDEVYAKSGAEKKLDEFLKEVSENDQVTILNINKIKNTDGSYTCEVEEDCEYYSGTEQVTVKLINISEDNEESLYEVEFPMEYGWTVTDYDTSQLKRKDNN